jgi:hypothetical protein
VTPEQQIARLEMLLGRVRKNAAAPRRRPAAAARSTAVAVTSSDLDPGHEPVELSDDDVVAVVSEPPPAVEGRVLGPTPASDDRVEAAGWSAPSAGEQPSQPEDLELELEDVVSAPEPSPAQLQPSEPPAALEPAAVREPTQAAEPFDAAAEQGAPKRESRAIRTLRPEAPSVEAPLADASEATASLELIEEDDVLELESIPPSTAVTHEPTPAQPQNELPELKLDEPGAAELELDRPAADTGPEMASAAGPGRAASPQAVEVARRPAISADAEPAIMSPAAPTREPQTFLQWLDASLKLG